MMKELKTGFRLLRYSYGIRSNCIMAGVFLLAGLGLVFLGDKYTELTGCYFLLIIGLIPTQLISSLSVSKMVQSSPMKKKIQTIIQVAVNLGCVLPIYLLESLVYGIRLQNGSEPKTEISGVLLVVAMMTALMMAYLGVSYKHFMISTVLFVFAIVYLLQENRERETYLVKLFIDADISFGWTVLTGLGIILAGGLVQYLLTLLFYKAPLGRMGQAVALRKEL